MHSCACTRTHAHAHASLAQVLRVFYDRLVDEEEQTWFLDTLKQTTSRYFRTDFDTLFAHLANGGGGSGKPTPITSTHLRQCFFGDYLSEMDENGAQSYIEILRPEVCAVCWAAASYACVCACVPVRVCVRVCVCVCVCARG